MTDTKNKSTSVKIDDTIEGLLRFFLRFLATHGHIAFRPHHSKILVDSLQKDPPPYTRPLTFLAIGAFLFALLIDVYPAGFVGLVDIVWFGDEIKENVSTRWKDALTLTTLITTGLPVILAVSLLAGASGLILFNDEMSRSSWFAINCYSFGFLITFLFFLMSIDTVISAINILFPFLKSIPIPETIIPLVLAVLVAFGLIAPLVVISISYIDIKGLITLRSKFKAVPLVFIYWLSGLYIIAQAASVIPDLTNTYFPEAVPETMIFEEMALEYQHESDSVDIYFQVIVENETKKDLLLELSDHQASIILSADPDDSVTETWQFDKLTLLGNLKRLRTNRAVISKESNKLLEMKATLSNWRDFYCKSTTLIAENGAKIRSGELDEAYQQLRLAFQPNFRLRYDRPNEINRMIDHEELFKFYDVFVNENPCADTRTGS